MNEPLRHLPEEVLRFGFAFIAMVTVKFVHAPHTSILFLSWIMTWNATGLLIQISALCSLNEFTCLCWIVGTWF
jgi:hypothetical protein